MQLKHLFILLLFCPFLTMAQYRQLEEKEIDILFDYYQQDGNHSPVTGGLGTEKLDCMAPLMTVNVPFDSVNNISVSFGVDYYSSASCNNIDRYLQTGASRSKFLSSASAQDYRGHGDISYTRKLKNRRNALGGMLGYSKEYDVNSYSAGLNFSHTSKDGNSEFAIKGSFYYDVWKLIFPGELRKHDTLNNSFIDPLSGKKIGWGHIERESGASKAGASNIDPSYSTEPRFTTTFTASFAQVLTRKLQMFVITDVVFQNGILWTPFHRVYFDDVTDKTLPAEGVLAYRYVNHEWLPNHKIKIPIGLRLNYYLNDLLTLRFFYRYYWDDFGMTSNTVSLEMPIKVTSWLTISPMYRYYQQTACKYFRPFGEHKLVKDINGNPIETTVNVDGIDIPLLPNTPTYKSQEQYFTSDYDLSALTNQKFALAFRFSPVYGLKKWKLINPQTENGIIKSPGYNLTFKSFELRTAYYMRSDGLRAFTTSFGLTFVF
jgi:hypothetical protein